MTNQNTVTIEPVKKVNKPTVNVIGIIKEIKDSNRYINRRIEYAVIK